MMLIAALTAALVTNSGRSAWFVGALVLMVYLVFAMSLYLLPARTSESSHLSQPTQRTPSNRRGVPDGMFAAVCGST
jgi:Ca2+:H+ antiporter